MNGAKIGSVFPIVIDPDSELLVEIVTALLNKPGGKTSFAVTSDGSNGNHRLRLSNNSEKYLRQWVVNNAQAPQ